MHPRYMALSALCGVAALVLGGCIAHTFVDDIVDNVSCHGAECAARPGVQVRVLAPRFSGESNEIAIPFLCKPPNGTQQELRAIFFNLDTNEWRRGAMPIGLEQEVQESLNPPTVEQIKAAQRQAPLESPHSCAADCNQSIWLARTDPIGRQWHYEVFHSQDGVTSQLTHFNIPGGPMTAPRMSANGRRAVLLISGKLGIVEVPSGTSSLIPIDAKISQDCSAS
jgi:hypothetical protein